MAGIPQYMGILILVQYLSPFWPFFDFVLIDLANL